MKGFIFSNKQILEPLNQLIENFEKLRLKAIKILKGSPLKRLPALYCGFYKRDKKWMWPFYRAFELGMELTANKMGVPLHFHDLYQLRTGVDPRGNHARRLKLF